MMRPLLENPSEPVIDGNYFDCLDGVIDRSKVRNLYIKIVFDHQAVHVREPNEDSAQALHGDSTIDTRQAFDIQLMYFPQRRR